MGEPYKLTIRPECLMPHSEDWPTPTGGEVATAMRLAGFTGSSAAKALGLKQKTGPRTVRKWIGNEAEIPYAVWALLCDFAGLGQIWRYDHHEPQT